jgi:hypothetical protein
MVRTVDTVPFLHVRHDPVPRRDGTASCLLGHQLPGGDVPDGVFARWSWDGNVLVVENDRYGYQPLFYFMRPGEICLSPRLLTLIERGAPRELDYDALAVHLHLGYFLAEDTPFRAIRAVPPRAEFRWSRDGLMLSGRRPLPRATNPDRAAARQTYQELFAEAVRKRQPGGPFGVLLSGGRDSRHILFELCRQGKKPTLAATLDLRVSSDGKVAAELAAGLGVPHLLVPAAPASRTLEARKDRETHLCADEHAWILPLRDELRGKVSTLFDGIGGDALSAGLFLEPHALELFRSRRTADLARHLIAEQHTAAFISRLLRPDLARQVSQERAVARLTRELEQHAEAPNPVGSYIFWNRTRREIALSPFSLFGDSRVFAPYLDHAVFDFLTGLPGELFLDHTFHDETIAEAYPEWAALPYAKKHKARCSTGSLGQAWSLIGSLALRRRTGLNCRALLPRLLRAGLDPRYNAQAMDYLLGGIVYWSQLEEVGGVCTPGGTAAFPAAVAAAVGGDRGAPPLGIFSNRP